MDQPSSRRRHAVTPQEGRIDAVWPGQPYPRGATKVWWTVLDTAAGAPFVQERLEPATPYPLQGRSLALLRETAYR